MGPLNSAFRVEIPPQWQREREYALRVLFEDWLGAPYSVRVRDDLDRTLIRLSSEPDGATIAIPDVLLARSTEWLSPGSLPPAILPTVDPPPWAGFEERFPILFDGGAGELVRQSGSQFSLRLDLVGSLVYMLARYEEHVSPRLRDQHGRFPAFASALGSTGWLQWPILDMYLHLFVALARLAWPRVQLAPLKGSGVLVSHDVDHPSSSIRWHGGERLRKVGGDLLRRRDVGLALRRASSFLPGVRAVSLFDPYNTYSFLMQTSESAGLRSTFFFLAKDTEIPYGSRYRLDDRWAARLMAEIAERGHHIGLHGSYHSPNDAARLREEVVLLEHACQGLPPGVLRRSIRQHYLRQQPGDTWQAQVDAGLTEDESLGFADAIGYRAGTARSFPAYDLANHRQLPLLIRPLHVMDRTLLEYMSLEEANALAMVAAMSGRTKKFGGDFSVLWHNSSLEGARTRRLYVELIRELTA